MSEPPDRPVTRPPVSGEPSTPDRSLAEPTPAAPGSANAEPGIPDRPATAEPATAEPAPAGERAADGEAEGGVDEEKRLARVERALRGTLAGSLILEALMVLFVPRTIAPLGDNELTGGRLAFLLGLAAALIVAAVLQRRRFGLLLGSVLQVPVVATGFLIGVMFVLGGLFAALWFYMLRARKDLLRPARPPAAS